MSAQHKIPGRSGKRARRERALLRMEERFWDLERQMSGDATRLEQEESQHLVKRIKALKAELARPLRPIPPHQSRKLTR